MLGEILSILVLKKIFFFWSLQATADSLFIDLLKISPNLRESAFTTSMNLPNDLVEPVKELLSRQ